MNGYVETSPDFNVAELKKVVFPVFVLPIKPIRIGITLLIGWDTDLNDMISYPSPRVEVDHLA